MPRPRESSPETAQPPVDPEASIAEARAIAAADEAAAAEAAGDTADDDAPTLADMVGDFEVIAEAEGHKSSETPAGPSHFLLDDEEEVIGERELGDGQHIVVTSAGRKLHVEEQKSGPPAILEILAGPGAQPDHDNPAPQPGTPDHRRAYGDE